MNKHAIKSGAIIGAISLVISLLMYIIDGSLFAVWWLGLLILAVIVALVAYFGVQHRNEDGGFMSFGQGWMYSMQAFIVAGIIGTIFRILLFTVIDPDLAEIVTEKAVENTAAMMESFGTPEEAMDKALEDARTNTMESFTAMGNIKAFGWGLIIYCIFSLITGAIIKKKEPETL